MAISNVVGLRKVVTEQETASLHDVAKAIGIKLRLADQNENDAANHRKEAGEMLVTLRKRVEADNQSWKQFVYDYFDRPRKEIEQLMRHVAAREVAKAAVIAHPHKSDRAIAKEIGVHKNTVARAREKTTGPKGPVETRVGADGKARKLPEPKTRSPREIAREKEQQQPQQNKPQSAPKRITLLFDEPCDDCVTEQEKWHRSASVMASEAASLPAYWTQQFGKDWQKFEVTSEVLALAKQAAEAWNEIEGVINRRKPPKIDMNVIKQAGAFHTELTKYTQEFVERVTTWHAANGSELSEEGHYCVVQALEMASMRLQQAAQDIDDR